MKDRASFQSKKTGVNWTDDEKRMYRDTKIAQTQELLHYLFPMMESTKKVQATQILNPKTNFQNRYRQKLATNIKKYSTSWALPINPPLMDQRNLIVSSTEWLQSKSQRSLESLSPFKGHKERKTYPQIKSVKTKRTQPFGGTWETEASRFEKEVNIIKGKSLLAAESSQQSSVGISPV